MPAAIAITFLAAPQSCTPRTSADGRRGSAALESARCRTLRDLRIRARDHARGRLPGGDLLGVVRPRERRDAARVVPRRLDDHVGEQAVRRRDRGPWRARSRARPGAGAARRPSRHRPPTAARARSARPRAPARARSSSTGAHGVLEPDARQVAAVLARRCELGRRGPASRQAQLDRVTSACEHARERGAPRARRRRRAHAPPQRSTRSRITGTPCSARASRSWFSSQ